MGIRIGLIAILFVAACGGDFKTSVDSICGDGVVDDGEDCDFGSANAAASGCELDCRFSCAPTGASCDNGDACDGVETCESVTVGGRAGYHCLASTTPADGTACGAGMVCVIGACTPTSCGDGIKSATEECDDGNSVPGDGCEANCRYSCLSTDATRNCAAADACAGQGTCNDTTHLCSAGTPLANNTACGTGGYCFQGACTQPTCGNNQIEPGEICDNGTNNGTAGNGCTTSCTYACVNAATDCGTEPVCQTFQCTASHACQAVADATQNGDACGGGKVCSSGACIAPTAVCGNGILEAGETCDFGTGNGAGTGCETNCTYSCTSASACSDNNLCNGAETCDTVTVSGKTGQKCFAGAPPTAGTTCGSGKICLSNACVTSTCGDGYVDMPKGETCEPPSVGTCSATCMAAQVCGDGIRSGTEQCDDGNTTNVDGCSGACKFEETQRFNALAVKFDVDTTCTKNALGLAAGSTAQSMINDAITAGVKSGSISVMMLFLGLDNLVGGADSSIQLGMITGAPVAATGYDGAADTDWWYTTDATTLSATRVPTTQVPAAIASNTLTSQPGSFSLGVQFAGVPVTMEMVSTVIKAAIDMTSITAPATSTGSTPGHLAAENLDPALTSFGGMNGGTVCGKTVARSLSNVQMAATLLTYCTNYTSANTLLDLYVGGCKYLGFINVVTATQPDGSRTGNDVYLFQTNAARQVTACTKNGTAAVLDDCLANATYSSYYGFTSLRVISK